MKKQLFSIALALAACAILSSCSIKTVPAGYRGIEVYNTGNKRGVQEKQLGVGLYLIGPFRKIYTFPVFQQNYVWDNEKAINFQSKEGLDVSGEFGISYSLVQDSIPVIFQKYRRGIDEITNIFLRNMVRDALNTTSSHMPIESIYGVHKRDLLLKVDSMVSRQTKRYGIIIDRIYTIGELHLPPSIEAAINAKLEANQRALQSQNEVKQIEAEAQKRIAKSKGEAESRVIEATAIANSQVIEAKANADVIKIRAAADAESIRLTSTAQAEANLKLAKSVSKDLIQYRSIDRWDGKLPQISGQNTPFINLNK
ncbi:MAG TPA: transposase [Cytophagales bacterium]|jgi:regulator of protease activity HflC (stomatin/prohibitin superfamily)|nr:transposase [Cytophagales bacterium]